ncbi:MAG TPA: dihydrolipoamide acetyltransferase family protein, partial [Acidimicrobiia bacterium]|nr:dihydrolipoamide acetyltransferase family protein [Acidimicrobiia bacterium]
MPQLGETVTEGTITRWLKQIGDRVEIDQPLFEVSTDKVDSEVPAPAAGYLSEIRVPEGETAAVGTVLAVIGDSPAGAAPTLAAVPEPSPEPPTAPVATPPPAPVTPPPSAPVAPAATEEPPVRAVPSEPEPSQTEQPAPSVVRPAAAASGAALTSPVVRRLIAEHGLDAAQIRGTGEGGRITRNDVLDAAAGGGPPTAPTPVAPAPVAAPPAPPVEVPRTAPAPPAPPTVEAPVPPEPPIVVAPPPPRVAPSPPTPPASPPPASPPPARIAAPPSAPAPPAPAPPAPPAPAPEPPPPVPAAPAPPEGLTDQVVPFSNIRRRTAEHMLRSKATSPHAYTSTEVDFERIARLREHRQADWRAREGFPLTYLPFVARAFGDVVQQFPHVNATVGDDALIVHRTVHLGIAVDLDFQGLVAPVIRNADGKRLRLLAREVRDLAERARDKQLLPDEVLGATFTITNPGPYGTFMTLPIISQPQVAILSTDGISKRPTVITDRDGADVIAVRHTGMLALAWDHRAFDGAYAAAFLRTLKEDLENRNWEAELD